MSAVVAEFLRVGDGRDSVRYLLFALELYLTHKRFFDIFQGISNTWRVFLRGL